jgi:uncharacterized protein
MNPSIYHRLAPASLSVVLAASLWYIMFVIHPLNFWLMMSFSTSLLTVISILAGRPLFKVEDRSLRMLLFGLLSAVGLYAIFWVGNKTLILAETMLPGFLPDRLGNITSVYANRGTLSPLVVGILLFFPIGFGEELFWRGFIQQKLGKELGSNWGFALTSLIYVAVHLPTGNPVLILAALTCGIFWGGLYRVTGSLGLVLISHMIWDPLIFIIVPIF